MAGSKRHILLVGGDGGRSGVPRYLGQMVRALAGHMRLSMVSDDNRGGYDFADAADVPLHQIKGLASGMNPVVRFGALRHLARLIRDDPPDLIWAHARMAVLLVRLWAVLHRGTPVAVTFHGLPFGAGHRAPLAWLSLRLERMFCRLMPAHHLLFLSDEAKRLYCREMPPRALARHQVHVLRNCSDLGSVMRAPRPENAGLRLVMFGRGGHQKNVAAAAPVLAALPGDAQLTLCGIGTDTDQIRAAFDAVAPRVHFAGEVADVRPYLAQADMLLMTSRYEGMPIAALEGFEAGLPLALPAIAGTAEIRSHHPLAATIDTDQPAQSAARIMEVHTTYLSDPSGHDAQIRKVWAQHFSYEVWSQGVRRLVDDLLARPWADARR